MGIGICLIGPNGLPHVWEWFISNEITVYLVPWYHMGSNINTNKLDLSTYYMQLVIVSLDTQTQEALYFG